MNIKNVVILFGGTSNERSISIKSGYSIYNILLKKNINVFPIDMKYFFLKDFLKLKIDKVFISLHGKLGEDGTIQGMLDFLNIPYTGSGVFTSSLAINKHKTKIFLSNFKINVLPDIFLNYFFLYKKNIFSLFNFIKYKLSLPFLLKPNCNGSSIGIKLINNILDFKKYFKFNKYINYDNIIAEKYILGQEYTVSVLDGVVLCPLKIIYNNFIFSFNKKYKSKNIYYSSIINNFIRKKLINISLSIWNILDCKGCVRIDYIVDKDHKIWFLEINTIPGMTTNSLVPISASFSGITYTNLIFKILNSN